jgi:uncharacterized protein involved in outer membrane biogenesis
MKRIFKWLLGLFLAAMFLIIVGVIVLILSYNSILRAAIERQIRVQTGMDVEIGSLRIALLSPTAEIRNLKIHNSRDFGGTPFLDIPEIHVEYDRAALARREIHVTLLRFNLGELDIVKNQTGQTNIFLPGIQQPSQQSRTGGTVPANTNTFLPGTHSPVQILPSTNAPVQKSGGGGNPLADFKRQSGYDFTGIDTLNVSIGKVKYIDLNNQQNNREQTIGIDELVIPNVKSLADLTGLAADIALHSNGFFDSLVGQKNSGLGILKQLGL